MNPIALDKYLTTEPDNGFHAWLDDVWKHIPESEISGDEYDKYEEFFDDITYRMCIGTRTLRKHSGFVNPEFFAMMLMRRFRIMKFNLGLARTRCCNIHSNACTCAVKTRKCKDEHILYQTCTCPIWHCELYYRKHFDRFTKGY